MKGYLTWPESHATKVWEHNGCTLSVSLHPKKHWCMYVRVPATISDSNLEGYSNTPEARITYTSFSQESNVFGSDFADFQFEGEKRLKKNQRTEQQAIDYCNQLCDAILDYIKEEEETNAGSLGS